ncbi:MAG: hypothetical protein J6M47_08705 [Clostridia bacterium]|nr:hypothetical protein [Clostridia bacterium]
MDIQKIITDAVKKLSENEDLCRAFMKNPVEVLEKKLGIDLPEDQINPVIDAIKAKIKVDDALEFAGKLKGLLGK